MSPDGPTRDAAAAEASRANAAWRQTLRLALALALSFTIGEAQDQTFAFLTALFAVQMLAKSPDMPSLKQGFGFALIMSVAALAALTLAGILLHKPVAYLLVMGILVFGCFQLQARGKGGPVPQLLLICSVALPVIAQQSTDLALAFTAIMVEAAIGAPLVVWLVHAILPTTAMPAARASPPPMADASDGLLRRSLLATLVLLLPFAWYMMHPNAASIVILITCIGILGQAPALQLRTAGGLLLGNLIGGVAASLAYLAVTLLPSLVLLFLVCLLAGIVLAARLYSPSPLAPVYAIALTTFLILLGTGLAPIGDGSAVAFIARLADVALASLYAIGAIILFRAAGAAAHKSEPPSPPGEKAHA
ncbi:MAG: DUF2955 domain-containing protein [Rhodospirillaceae bacterium]|nr:DUF2955 domain-containing protein [Rhodospirillaceae bacterium]